MPTLFRKILFYLFVLVYCVVGFGRQPKDATINLLAPVVLNPGARRGRQVVLEESGYAVTAPLGVG